MHADFFLGKNIYHAFFDTPACHFLQGQSLSPVLLHKAVGVAHKGQQLLLVGLGKQQTANNWGENGFQVSN
jgi:hypothetical protein